MKPYEDPKHYGNSSRYWTRKPCIEKDCERPAGTLWSPLWCMEHNIERMKRINKGFNTICKMYQLELPFPEDE